MALALDTEACPLITAAGLRRRLEVELGDRVTLNGRAGEGAPMRLEVRCDEAGVQLTLEPGGGQAPVARRVRFEGEPESGRRRLVALAATEMVAATLDTRARADAAETRDASAEESAEPSEEPAEREEPAVNPFLPAEPPPPTAPESPAPTVGFALRAGGAARITTAPFSFLAGLTLGVDGWFRRRLMVSGELGLARGVEPAGDAGEVRLLAITAAGRVGVRLPLRGWGHLAVAGGISLGYGNLRGASAFGAFESTIAGSLIGPELAIGALLPLTEAWGLHLGLVADWWAKGVVGVGDGGRTLARLEDFSLALTVGLAWRAR